MANGRWEASWRSGKITRSTKRFQYCTTAKISATLPYQAPANPNNQTSPVPNIPVYHGRALREFKTYARGLERHFGKYPGWYITDERKTTRALKHVAFNLQNEWKRHIRDMPSEQVTFVYPEVAKTRYMDTYQRPFQSVTYFSNWIQQGEPHFHNELSKRDRMRHLFKHLSHRFRDKADKTQLDFTHYDDFVVYLQRKEDCCLSRCTTSRKLVTPGSELTLAAESTPST
ncbi:unnamed protein product [Penicillium salamii]|uniref:Uncharacterized protein n=1 Tax=Penicillium salamii TaxID=1612424 RepID=A0A9W4IWX0_9EURO|nr:unnamed protein product [Penicillium salamii]CAG8015630.1 unnamed protein product [Penicillium salamii]CAG8031345.1 unnamed protein product [Penicillium salamii]CAG8326916.1 unnamed protein product [Penicillium salamii]CAG8328327.1 unnamed protein product [Penicillium salamii]